MQSALIKGVRQAELGQAAEFAALPEAVAHTAFTTCADRPQPRRVLPSTAEYRGTPQRRTAAARARARGGPTAWVDGLMIEVQALSSDSESESTPAQERVQPGSRSAKEDGPGA